MLSSTYNIYEEAIFCVKAKAILHFVVKFIDRSSHPFSLFSIHFLSQKITFQKISKICTLNWIIILFNYNSIELTNLKTYWKDEEQPRFYFNKFLSRIKYFPVCIAKDKLKHAEKLFWNMQKHSGNILKDALINRRQFLALEIY